MDYFTSQDQRSYSFYFDLNIWFRARKVIGTLEKRAPSRIEAIPGRSTLGISEWGCAAGTLEPLSYTRYSSAEFCYRVLE